MKQLLLLTLFLASTALAAQAKPIRQFIRQHNDGPENVSLTIPGFLIGLAGEIGMLASDDDEDRAAFALAQALGTTRLLVFNGKDFDTQTDVRNLLRQLERKHDFERWATVRAASGERIELTVQMRGDAVREIIAFVDSPDDDKTVFLHARTNFTAEELGQIVNELAD